MTVEEIANVIEEKIDRSFQKGGASITYTNEEAENLVKMLRKAQTNAQQELAGSQGSHKPCAIGQCDGSGVLLGMNGLGKKIKVTCACKVII